jgi:hypothetical protein
MTQGKKEPFEVRFWKMVSKPTDENGCWIWKGSTRPWGYGHLGSEKGKHPKMVKAHRAAYTICVGPIPDGMFVCHHCDNPACVNPAHLFIGTPKDGLHVHPERAARGERNGAAKLNEHQVIEIRTLYAQGGITFRSLARQYGVCKSTIGYVIHRYWKHVTP